MALETTSRMMTDQKWGGCNRERKICMEEVTEEESASWPSSRQGKRENKLLAAGWHMRLLKSFCSTGWPLMYSCPAPAALLKSETSDFHVNKSFSAAITIQRQPCTVRRIIEFRATFNRLSRYFVLAYTGFHKKSRHNEGLQFL